MCIMRIHEHKALNQVVFVMGNLHRISGIVVSSESGLLLSRKENDSQEEKLYENNQSGIVTE